MTGVAVESRRLAAVLLLWALVPMPFLYILTPPFWLTAAAAAAVVLLRPGSRPQLSPWQQNLLGVAIVVAVVAAGGLRIGPLRPLGHLLVLLTALRVLTLANRRELLRALPALFLVWLVSVANSTHVTAVLYVGASAVVWWWAGVRVHLLGFAEATGTASSSQPPLRPILVAALVTALLAVPVFVAVPRLRSPLIAGRGDAQSVTGFSSSVDLNSVGTVVQSHEAAVRIVRISGQPFDGGWTRLRGTALDLVNTGAWISARREVGELPLRQGRLWLTDPQRSLSGLDEVEVTLLDPGRYLLVPETAVAIEVDVPVRVDPRDGAVRLASYRREPLTFRAWLGDHATPRRLPPRPRDLDLPNLDPRVRALAAELLPREGSVADRARRLERHLQTAYAYDLSSGAGMRDDPVATFLFERRAGHCEFFAAAMAVLLRAEGLPARMVVGYSGAALAADGNEALVRESNAHAWVELWQGAENGWVSFDPTPPDDRPAFGGPSGLDRLRWTWQSVEAFWDRYVLTFGFGEQVDLVQLLGGTFDALRSRGSWIRLVTVALVVVALLLLLAGRVRRSRPGWRPRALRRPPAARRVARLASELERAGERVVPGATPRSIGRMARRRWPGAAGAVTDLVWFAERELYAGGPTGVASPTDVVRLWTRVRREMTAAGRRSP